ncbi:MAG: transposase [Gammaproteobacteria bacterium]|nr:transposase [Gammaproteobacteria bacterium]
MSARARQDLWLTGKIEAIHRRSRGAYGSPMIHAELADDHGIRIGRKRVARLMRSAGLRGVTLRRSAGRWYRQDFKTGGFRLI